MADRISDKDLESIETAKKQILDEEEQKNIGGGERCSISSGNGCQGNPNDEMDDICVVDYCCFTAFMHPDDTSGGDSCWSDYMCFFIKKH